MATRSAATGIVLDLSSQGASSVTQPPGSQINFTLPAPKFDANGNYPRACRLVVRVTGGITQGEGDLMINWSELARVVRSFETRAPLFGTIHSPETFTGPVAKHIAEFFSHGQAYYGGVGAGLPTAGTPPTPFEIEYALPFAHESFFSPLDFAPWVGWLSQMQLFVNLADATVFASAITGGDITGNLTVSAWIEAVPTKTLELPAINQWRAYFPPASGGTTALLQDVGGAGGLSCVLPGSRIAAIIETCNSVGLGGPAAATAYTSFACDQLNQPVTYNVASFVKQQQALSRQSVVGGRVNGAGVVLPNRAGNPYTENGTQMYQPWRVPGSDAEIGSQIKWTGNLQLYRNFTVAPSSGQFPIITNEIRQLSEQSVNTLLTNARVSQSRADQAKRAYYDGTPSNPRSGFAMPIRIPNR